MLVLLGKTDFFFSTKPPKVVSVSASQRNNESFWCAGFQHGQYDGPLYPLQAGGISKTFCWSVSKRQFLYILHWSKCDFSEKCTNQEVRVWLSVMGNNNFQSELCAIWPHLNRTLKRLDLVIVLSKFHPVTFQLSMRPWPSTQIQNVFWFFL